uniref:EPOP protein n=1 Tax=Cyanoderma ruficeps TaxID=181631 RepID=A0A8C3NYE0_9PASS
SCCILRPLSPARSRPRSAPRVGPGGHRAAPKGSARPERDPRPPGRAGAAPSPPPNAKEPRPVIPAIRIPAWTWPRPAPPPPATPRRKRRRRRRRRRKGTARAAARRKAAPRSRRAARTRCRALGTGRRPCPASNPPGTGSARSGRRSPPRAKRRAPSPNSSSSLSTSGPAPSRRRPSPAPAPSSEPSPELRGNRDPAAPGEPRPEHFDRLIRRSKLWCYAKGFNLDGKTLRPELRFQPRNAPCKTSPARNSFSLMGNFPCTPSLVVGEDGDLCPASSLGGKNSWALSKTHPLWRWHLG